MKQLLLSLSSISFIGGTFFVVDTDQGNDQNNGTSLESPFKTIQRCVDTLSEPGDSCNLRKGRYHEEVVVNGLRGSREEPFVIRGYKEERPIWDGSVPIQPQEWDFDETTGICSAQLDEETIIFALLLDDQLLTPARWPNALWEDKTVFNNSFWGKADKESERGNITDDGTLDLAGSGINATGAMAVLNIGSFDTYVRKVLFHQPGSPSFTYNDDLGNIHWNPRFNQYYFEASLELLDNPGEWFFDVTTGVLYLIPPSGKCPDTSSKNLRGRTLDYGLTITNTTGLTVANLTFLAATIDGHSEDRGPYIDEICLDSVDFLFQSSSHRMLGSDSLPKVTRLFAYSNTPPHKIRGRVHVVNCTFTGGEGFALQVAGNESVIENNLFLYNDWTGHTPGNGATLYTQAFSTNDIVIHNTFISNGKEAGIRLGDRPTIQYNEIVGQCEGRIANDGAAVQVQTNHMEGAVVSYNWAHDSPKAGFRFDSSPGKLGEGGYQGYNVAWNTGTGFMVKGDKHIIEHNLGLDEHGGRCSLCVIYRLRNEPEVMNNASIVMNNAATQADGGIHTGAGGASWPLAGEIKENNFADLEIAKHLVDPSGLDFRPVEGGPLTRGPEIIGPYQVGFQSSYWIPGRRLYVASRPIPPSGSVVPANRDVLIFQPGFRSDSHEVHFGLAADHMTQLAILKGEENMVSLPMLQPKTTYYWRVETHSGGGQIYKGEEWNFTTSAMI